MTASHNARVPTAPAPDESDETLMLRYAAGDLDAFDTLYGRHELAVWRFVYRSVKVRAVADDLLQDVWFAVARSAGSYDVKARFRTWLFTLAHHRLVDHLRTARHHASLDEAGDEKRTKEFHGNAPRMITVESMWACNALRRSGTLTTGLFFHKA